MRAILPVVASTLITGQLVEMTKAGNIKLENIWFAGMTAVGSDANKIYDDVLYDAVNKQIIDAGQESYSSTFFKAQKGNKVLTDVNELKFKDGRNIGVNYMPDADSPVLTALEQMIIGWIAGLTSILIIQTTNTPLNIHTHSC